MTIQDVEELTIPELESEIARAAANYYTPSREQLYSDALYDAMIDQLASCDPEHPLLSQIGVTPEDHKKVELPFPMLSLDKVKTPAEFNKWWKKMGQPHVVMMDKLDGVALSLTYRTNVHEDRAYLVSACTRGDGQVGEDATAQVLQGKIEGIPDVIQIPGDDGLVCGDNPDDYMFQVTGEIVISRKDLQRINLRQKLRGEKLYANTRNLANATITLDDLDEVRFRKLHFRAYNMSSVANLHDKIAWLAHVGFDPVISACGSQVAPPEMRPPAYVNRGWNSDLSSQDFDCDGMVVAISNWKIQDDLGVTSHHPRWAIAVKYPDETTVVEIKDLDWSVSKTGTVTPQAMFDGVLLGGAEIERCTLHNVAHVIDHRIGPGTMIKLTRSGGVIPKFLGVVSQPGFRTVSWKYPKVCPSCGEALKLELPELKCGNTSCQAQIAMALENFLKTIEFKGIGEKTCEQLAQARIPIFDFKRITQIPQLWQLSRNYLGYFCGWGPEHASKVYNALHEIKKDVPLAKMLAALQIPMLGRSASEKIAQRYLTIDAAFEGAQLNTSWWPDNLGPNVGWDICHALDRSGFKLWLGLESVGFTAANVVPVAEGALRVCITGKLGRGRSEYKELLEGIGHVFDGSLSKGTDVLVTGENVGSGKTSKAEKYGTEIKDEAWLIELIRKSQQ